MLLSVSLELQIKQILYYFSTFLQLKITKCNSKIKQRIQGRHKTFNRFLYLQNAQHGFKLQLYNLLAQIKLTIDLNSPSHRNLIFKMQFIAIAPTSWNTWKNKIRLSIDNQIVCYNYTKVEKNFLRCGILQINEACPNMCKLLLKNQQCFVTILCITKNRAKEKYIS